MVEDGGGLADVGRGRILAIRFMGTCFGFLGGVAALAGVFGIIEAFRFYNLVDPAFRGIAGILQTIGVPVLIGVAGTWLFFGIGRGLRHGSPLARRVAAVLLVLACIPPLVLLFQAVRAEVYAGAALALLILAPPAAGSLLLTDWETDRHFRPKGAVLVDEVAPVAGSNGSAVELILKGVWLLFGLVATIVILNLVRSP